MIKGKVRYLFFILFCLVCFSGIIVFSNLEQNSIDAESPKASSSEIELISPENISYTSAMNGYFPGTFSFESDLPGSVPEKWINNSQSSCTVSIVDEYQNHSKVLYIDGRNLGEASIQQTFPGVISGTVELWINTANKQERN